MGFVYTNNVRLDGMQNLSITTGVFEKLKGRHFIDRSEVEQCFLSRTGKDLIDHRARNRTNPPTYWFLSKTNKGRFLKIVYIQIVQEVILKSAFEPNEEEIEIYRRFG